MNSAIEVRNLTKQYPGFALKDVSFQIPEGSIVGFIGENGAGKSTAEKLHCLARWTAQRTRH